jgi:hypothetical protein
MDQAFMRLGRKTYKGPLVGAFQTIDSRAAVPLAKTGSESAEPKA